MALAALAQEFSPRYELARADLVTIDVRGLDRLLGSPSVVAAELAREAAARGVRAHIALASTHTAAAVLALARPGVTVVEPGEQAAALAPLPIGLLEQIQPQNTPNPPKAVDQNHRGSASSAISAVKHWGIRTLGELAALPPADLAARLGRGAAAWQAIARGEDTRPLVPALPDERFDATLELEWPIEAVESLSFVLTRLLEPLSTRLERRDRGAAVLHVRLRLGPPAERGEIHARRLELPTPMRDVRTLRTLALLDLESHPPAAPIESVTVVIDPTPGRVLQHTLFARAHPTPERLSTLIARLGALMGQDRIGAAAAVDSYHPGAFAMKPYAVEHEDNQRRDRRNRRERFVQNSAGSANSALVSALRRCRQPVPARVIAEHDRPVRVTTDRRGYVGGSVSMPPVRGGRQEPGGRVGRSARPRRVGPGRSEGGPAPCSGYARAQRCERVRPGGGALAMEPRRVGRVVERRRGLSDLSRSRDRRVVYRWDFRLTRTQRKQRTQSAEVLRALTLCLSASVVENVSSYVEFHTASAFSFLQGASLPEALVDRAAELGYPALALLDRDGVYGAPRFHKAARAAGIRPIIGAELTITGSLKSGSLKSKAEVDRASDFRLQTSDFTWMLPVLCESAEGYRNLCRLITRMKMRAPKGEGALTLDDLDGMTTGLVVLAGRAALETERFGVGGLVDRLVGIFGRDHTYVELQRHYRREEEAANETLTQMAAAFRVPTLVTNGVRFAAPASRPLFDVLTCIHHHTDLMQAGRRLAPNAERYLKAPDEMAALFARSCGRRGAHARAGGSAAVHDGRSRIPIPRLPGAGRRNADVVSAPHDRARRLRSLPAVPRPRPRADRPRARPDRKAGARRLFPDRLGRRELLPPAGHPRPGTRFGGEQRRVLQPGHHGGRPGRHGSPVRAVPVGGARRMARHRSRPAERRPARAGDPARLREVRTPWGGDDRQRDHLSRPQRRARGRQDARLRRRAGRSAREGDEPLRVHRSGRHAPAPSGVGRSRCEFQSGPDVRAAVGRDAGSAAPSRPAFGRHGDLPGTARFSGAARERHHAGARGRPVGQGRLRRHGHRQGRSARPRDDGRDPGRARAGQRRTHERGSQSGTSDV